MNTNFTAFSSTKQEYPVIDPEPDYSKVVHNIKIAHIFSQAPILATWGYFLELNPAMRGRAMVLGGLIGLASGYNYAFLASYGRLTGLFKNDDGGLTGLTGLGAFYAHSFWTTPGVRGVPNVVTGGLIGLSFAFGRAYLATADRMDHDELLARKYPVIDPKPDFSNVVDNIKIAPIAGSVPFFATLVYLLGPKAMGGRNMVFGGVFGVVSGCYRAYGDSYSRLTGLSENDDEVAKYNKK